MGALGRLVCGRLGLQGIDKAAKRHAAVHLVLPRQLRHVQHVGQRLFTAGAEHEPHVRPRARQQRRDRVGSRPAVPVAVKRGQEHEGVPDRVQMRG